MDDANTAAMEETMLSNLITLKTRLNETGLKINDHSSEESPKTVRALREILPGITFVSREHMFTLGITTCS